MQNCLGIGAKMKPAPQADTLLALLGRMFFFRLAVPDTAYLNIVESDKEIESGHNVRGDPHQPRQQLGVADPRGVGQVRRRGRGRGIRRRTPVVGQARVTFLENWHLAKGFLKDTLAQGQV